MSKIVEDCRDPPYVNVFLFHSHQKLLRYLSIPMQHLIFNPARLMMTSYLILLYADDLSMQPQSYLHVQ